MKRTLSLLLLLSLLCLASCKTAGDKTDGSSAAPSEPLSSPQDMTSDVSTFSQPAEAVCTVDETVWSSALKQEAIRALPDFSIQWESREESTGLNMTMDAKFTPSAVFYTMILLNNPMEQLLLNKDGKGILYANAVPYGWVKSDGYDRFETGYAEIIDLFLADDVGRFAYLADCFSLFSFDEAKQAYVAKGVPDPTPSSEGTIDWTVTFSDGKLLSIESAVRTNTSHSHVLLNGIGSTVIDLPAGIS